MNRFPAFVPQQVSRFYRYDWQYAVDIARLPFIRPASLLISLMPILVHVSVPIGIWVSWISAILFVSAWALLYTNAPKFITEYRDYGEYCRRNHSHRWIVWEFYNSIESLAGKKAIIQETLFKGLAFRTETEGQIDDYRLCPVFPKPKDGSSVEVLTPFNHLRDIYLPIHCYGERVILPLQEDDQKLEEKEKELFWILYSQAAKERPKRRYAYWTLVYLAALLLAGNVVYNIFRVIRLA